LQTNQSSSTSTANVSIVVSDVADENQEQLNESNENGAGAESITGRFSQINQNIKENKIKIVVILFVIVIFSYLVYIKAKSGRIEL